MSNFFKPATFVTVWDSGHTVITTKCQFNNISFIAKDIEMSDEVNDLGIMDETYIETADGKKVSTFYNLDKDKYIAYGQPSFGTALTMGDNDEPVCEIGPEYSKFYLRVQDLFDIKVTLEQGALQVDVYSLNYDSLEPLQQYIEVSLRDIQS